MMKKLATLLLTLGLIASAAMADTVKIGVILPLTGNSAHLGERFSNAIKLFKADYPADNYEIIIEDDQFLPRQTAMAAKKLIEVDKVNALITWASNAGNIVSPMAEKAGVVHFNISLDPNVTKGEYNFTHWTVPEIQTQALASEFARRSYKRVAIISLRYQAGMVIAENTQKACKENSIETYLKYFNPGEIDFRSMLLKIQQHGPYDAYMLVAFSPQLEILIRQIHETGINLPLTACNSFDFMSDYSLVEGNWYVGCASPTDDWNQRFEELNGSRASFAEPYLYNMLLLITDAFNHVGQLDNQKAAEWIMNIKDYPSIIGTLNIDNTGIVLSQPSFYKAENGKRILIK